jgi:hypothetical protein
VNHARHRTIDGNSDASPKRGTHPAPGHRDIGGIDAYHVGDESMLLGLIQGVAACGIDAE